MTTIQLTTIINAPIEDAFNLSRDISFHLESASQTKEEAIAGVNSGLIGLNESVTWRGKHFGLFLNHTSKITAFDFPNHFTDEMIKGHFKTFKHQHVFVAKGTKTEMLDILEYKVPFGILGRFLDYMFVNPHLKQFLKTRNKALKDKLES